MRQPFTPVEIGSAAAPSAHSLAMAGDAPYLEVGGGITITGAYAIGEYLDEQLSAGAGGPGEGGIDQLLPGGPEDRAEARRLVDWFLRRLEREVTAPLLAIKLWPRLAVGAASPPPRAEQLRPLHAAMRAHLEYLGYLTDNRRWLAGDVTSLADLAAAASVSVLDYLGEIEWDAHPVCRTWYARMKSRPSFRPLLADSLPQCPPPPHYADLDF